MALFFKQLFYPAARPPIDRVRSAEGSLLIAAACTVLFFNSGLQPAYGLVLKALFADASMVADDAIKSIVLSLQYGCFNAGGLLAGLLIRHYGPRITVLLGALLSAVGLGASSVAPSVEWLMFTTGVVLGCGAALVSTAALVVTTQHFIKQRGFALGLVLAGSGIGSLSLAPAVQALLDARGWRGTLVVLAIILAVALPIASWPFLGVDTAATSNTAAVSSGDSDGDGDTTDSATRGLLAEDASPDSQGGCSAPSGGKGAAASAADTLPHAEDESVALTVSGSADSPGNSKGTADELQAARLKSAAAAAAVTNALQHTYCSLLRVWPLVRLLTGIAIYSGGFFTIMTLAPSFAGEESVTSPAILITVQGAANTVGRLLLGRISDCPGVDKLSLLQVCMAIAAVVAGIVAAAPASDASWIVFMIIFGSCAGSITATAPAVIAALVPASALPLALGLTTAFQALPIVAFPPTVRALREATGSYAPGPWLLLTVSMLVSSLLLQPRIVQRFMGAPIAACRRFAAPT